jgi:hypothetical protein
LLKDLLVTIQRLQKELAGSDAEKVKVAQESYAALQRELTSYPPSFNALMRMPWTDDRTPFLGRVRGFQLRRPRLIRLEDLQPSAVVRGVLPDCLVTVVSLQWFGADALELYKTPAGKVANELLYRNDEDLSTQN